MAIPTHPSHWQFAQPTLDRISARSISETGPREKGAGGQANARRVFASEANPAGDTFMESSHCEILSFGNRSA